MCEYPGPGDRPRGRDRDPAHAAGPRPVDSCVTNHRIVREHGADRSAPLSVAGLARGRGRHETAAPRGQGRGGSWHRDVAAPRPRGAGAGGSGRGLVGRSEVGASGVAGGYPRGEPAGGPPSRAAGGGRCGLLDAPGGAWRQLPVRWRLRPGFLSFLRKEVIQPQVPLRLPCYDLVPITGFIFGACLAAPTTSDAPHFGGLTGGVYKAQEHIHRGSADPRLLAIPASCGRVAARNPNWGAVFAISPASRPRGALSAPL